MAPLLLLIGPTLLFAGLLLIPWAVQAQSDPTNPTRPTNLTAAIVDGGIALEWNAPTQDTASVDGYQILRRRPQQDETTLTALAPDTNCTATTYTDTTATEAGVVKSTG